MRHYNPTPEASKTKRSPDSLSRERIRQIEKMALRKMRLELLRRGYRPDDLIV